MPRTEKRPESPRAPLDPKRIVNFLLRALAVLTLPALALLAPRLLADGSILTFIQGNLGYVLLTVTPVLTYLGREFISYQRSHPARPQRGRPAKPPRPRLPAGSQWLRDNVYIVANLDHTAWRIFYLAGFVVALGAVIRYPVSVADISGIASAYTDDPDAFREVLIGLLAPLGYWVTVNLRLRSIHAARADAIREVWKVAHAHLKYPKTAPRTNPDLARLFIPHVAVDVKTWRGLFEIDSAFVLVPPDLSVGDRATLDEFDTNLNAKVQRNEEWRVRKDPRGRGVTIGPANYPRAVLWDGEYDADPLTFILGSNLETGKPHTLSFGDASPHMALSGGTSSGKSSLAEIIAAQVLVKPMPWDPNLYGQAHIVDPKGPFARRWIGRPGVVVSDGSADALVEDAETGAEVTVTGPVVMALHMAHIEAEHQRRAKVLARYPDVGTWIHLPAEVLKAERFFPIVVILDEYIDHTDMEKAGEDERIKAENDARASITRWANWHARKYRNVGMHTILIAQRVNMGVIGNVLMSNLPIRSITGQMDRSQTESMFGTNEVPSIPSTRFDPENPDQGKTIPGRARIMNAIGQSIHKVQVSWFGGSTNSETLDKWLPRGERPANGDFTVPAGKPNQRGDDGQPVLPEAPPADWDGAPAAASSTPETAPASDSVTPEEPTPTPPWEDEPGTASDPAAEPLLGEASDEIFPAAGREVLPCSAARCVEDAVTTCSECTKPICPEHRTPSPDPEGGILCPSCTAIHPLTINGAESVYSLMYGLARANGLTATYVVREADNAVVATVWTPERLKVVEVLARSGVLKARSKSGQADGAAVKERVREVIVNYAAARKATEEAAS